MVSDEKFDSSSDSFPENQSVSDYQSTIDGPLVTEKKRSQIPFWFKVSLVIFGISFLGLAFLRQYQPSQSISPDPRPESQEAAIRSDAPNVSFKDAEGRDFQLSDFKGKVVLLSFWAHWCAPCLVEMPSFKSISERFNDQVVILPLNVDNPGEADSFIKNFWATEQLPFTNYFDPDKSAAKAYNVEGLPANFVIDKEGRIVVSSFGSNDWGSEASLEIFKGLVNE